MKHAKVIEALKTLPEDFALEELVERLVLIEKVEEGLQDEAAGNMIAAEDVQEYFRKKWNTK